MIFLMKETKMAREVDETRVTIKDVRLSYPHIFRPQRYADGEGEPAFNCSFLIDKSTKIGKINIGLIENAIEAALDKKYGGKNVPKIKADKMCLKDGDADDEGPEETIGMMILSARNATKPVTLDLDKTEVVEADGVLYAGCYVDAIVGIWVQDNKYGKRINGSLEGVRFRRDGEAFGAARVTADDFDDDEDDRPARRKAAAKDDDEDDRPARRKAAAKDDDEDDRPARRSRSNRDDDL
jgi:hypothetical protein